jgi:hypothetical protein
MRAKRRRTSRLAAERGGDLTGWWTPGRSLAKARWVLGERDGRVLYGKGGVRHYECSRAAFLQWIRRRYARRESRR